MATATNELFNISQDFFSPAILQKISSEINQPIEQTKIGLKSVIPTLLVGIVNKGSTKEGAETIYSLANKQLPTTELTSEAIDSKKGNDVINGIFGGNLSSVISQLGESTGMNSTSITKMLGMVAAPIMGTINSKVRSEHLSPSGLMNFFRQQRPSISSFVPASLANFPSMATTKKSKIAWPRIVLIALAAAAIVWWLNSFELFKTNRVAMDPPLPRISDEIKPTTAYSVGELSAFMASPLTAGRSQRFRFDSLTFKTGTTGVGAGAEYEINQVVTALKQYPSALLRIEGFTDNVGSASNNQTLSRDRAMAVKKELVSRGISSSRIETLGMGENDPIETNSTENGRAANRRIEFIIRR